MKPARISMFIIFLLLFGLLLPCSYLKAEDAQEYFPLNDGDKWEYEVVEGADHRVEEWRVEGKSVVDNIETKMIVDGAGNSRYLITDLNSVSVYKDVEIEGGKVDEYFIFEPVMPLFVFGIEQEKAVKKDYSFTRYDPNGSFKSVASGNLEMMFEGKENVVVPAGEFTDCLKISISESVQESDGEKSRFTTTAWFAKGVGKVKEIEENAIEDSRSPQSDVGAINTRESSLKKAVVNGISYPKVDAVKTD